MRGMERGVYLAKETVTDHDVVSDEEMESHPFYKMLSRHGLRYFAGIPISPDPHIVASIAVQRAVGRSPFNVSEIEMVTQLGRHAETALRLSLRLINLNISEIGLGESLSRVGIGVFLLDSLARVLFVNPAGKALARSGIGISRQRLEIQPCPERVEIESAIRQATKGVPARNGAAARTMLLHQADGRPAIAIHVLPIVAPSRPEDLILTHAKVIVLAIQPDPGGAADPAQVRDLLGVTLGEAKVAALVGSGLAPREAASRLGIKEETARSALKRVFSKTGVSRQSELSVLLTKLVLR